MSLQTKTCTRCKQEKDISEFWKSQKVCKNCSRELKKNWRISNPERYEQFRNRQIIYKTKKRKEISEKRLCRKCKNVKMNKYKRVCVECKIKTNREYVRKWRKNNYTIYKESNVRSNRKSIDTLCDNYIRRILIGKSTMKRNDIPQILIELSRLNLILKRLKKEKLLC